MVFLLECFPRFLLSGSGSRKPYPIPCFSVSLPVYYHCPLIDFWDSTCCIFHAMPTFHNFHNTVGHISCLPSRYFQHPCNVVLCGPTPCTCCKASVGYYLGIGNYYTFVEIGLGFMKVLYLFFCMSVVFFGGCILVVDCCVCCDLCFGDKYPEMQSRLVLEFYQTVYMLESRCSLL